MFAKFLANEISKRPDRFGGFAALPMQDPDLATEELTRCVKELGLVGANVNSFTQKDEPETHIFYDIRHLCTHSHNMLKMEK